MSLWQTREDLFGAQVFVDDELAQHYGTPSVTDPDALPEGFRLGPTPYLDSKYIDREHQYRTNDYGDGAGGASPLYQLAFDTYQEVAERGDMFKEHARVRHAMAAKLRDEVYPATLNKTYLHIANKLQHCRQVFHYGYDTLEQRSTLHWYDRAGLAKYCPDDARDLAMRTQARYVPRLIELMGAGCQVRYGVFTWPNVPTGHLAAATDGIFKAFRDRILYARTDGKIAKSIDDKKRLFPSLVGAMATMEAPWSRLGDWNIHLNVLLIFRDPGFGNDQDNWRTVRTAHGFDRVPDYKPLQERWGAGVKFRTVPADPDAAEAAMRELVKYPFKAISTKSEEKQGRGAPPWLQWPVDAIDEWHRAHRAIRRTRSWGALYHRNVPEEEKNRAWVHWLGKGWCGPDHFRLTVPSPPDEATLFSIIGTNFRGNPDIGGAGPPPYSGH